MRMEEWKPEMVAFARDAAEFTGYYDQLARSIADIVGGGKSLCDAGCGLGYLGSALAGAFDRVDLVDRAPQAVSYAAQLAAARSQGNVFARLGDMFEARGRRDRYDCMVFCTCCVPPQAVRVGLAQCRGTVVVLNRMEDARVPSRVRPGVRPGDDARARRVTEDRFASIEGALRAQGVRFSSGVFELEFGQPFETLESARRWFALYRNRTYPNGPTDEQLRSHLEPGCGRWRFYLPKRRRLSLFAFDVSDMRAACSRNGALARSALVELEQEPCYA